MEFVNIPLVPQWNLISCCISTPDDGFLYIGSKCINYVSNIQLEENSSNGPTMKVFHTRQRVKCIDCDPDWSTTKYFAALVDDNSVQIWDFNESKAKFGHKAHIKQVYGDGDGPPLDAVKLCFLKNRNVLSIDSNCLIMYCLQSNTYTKRKRIVPTKHEISILKCSPYDENIVAVGTTRGLILLIDLKLETVLSTLRGHETEITSLSWIQIALATEKVSTETEKVVLPTKPKQIKRRNIKNQNEEIFDIYDYDYLENEFGAPMCTNKITADSDNDDQLKNSGLEKTEELNENFNFAEACQNLRDDIIALKDGEQLNTSTKQVTLNDCQEAINKLVPNSNSSISCQSNDSLELVDRSSDESFPGDHEIVHRVDVHKEDENIINEQQTFNIYLASGSHESVVWIWDTKTGAFADKINLKSSSHNAFIETCWINESTLITNTKSGELMQWNCIQNYPKKTISLKLDKRQFTQRGVISLCKLTNSERIWTISSYREIICEDLLNMKIIAKYSCASTNIATIKERPDDMNQIAFACFDKRIGILDLSNISKCNIFIENCSNKIDSAVMSLCWSGVDSQIVFGTMEGKIAIIDTEKPSNAPFVMNPFCGKPIYTIQWIGSQIFACGNKKLAIYSSNKKDKDPFVLENITNISSFSVCDNFLLAGKQSGELDLYRKFSETPCKYEFIFKQSLGTKYISDINWSPIARHRCAAVSLQNKVWILTLANETLTLDRTITMGDTMTSGNASIKWSNQNENLLMTCSFDGAIRIWDLNKTSSDRHIFLKQFNCPMLCGLFAPYNDNIVICAGKATSIEMFDRIKEKQSEYSSNMSSKINKRNRGKPLLADVQWATKMVSAIGPNQSKEKRRNRKRSSNRNQIISTTEESETKDVIQFMAKLDLQSSPPKYNTEKQEDSSGCSGALFLKNHSTILHLIAKESNKDALENLMKILQDTDSENEVRSKRLLSAKLFGSRQDVQELLDDELRNHYASGTKSIANVLIPQIKGDLKEEILKCIQLKKLTEWHVSLAPTISYDFWKKCCIAYAHQLLEIGLVLQASTYFLASHDVKEVINQFLNGNYYREAWVIGKIYRTSDDPILNEILEKWITYLEMNGHFEGASLICALSGQYKKCYTILNKRQKPTGEHSKILDLLKFKLAEDVIKQI